MNLIICYVSPAEPPSQQQGGPGGSLPGGFFNR